MSEPSPPNAPTGESRNPEGRSILNEKLAVAPPPPGPESLRDEERATIAEEKVGLTLKGWRLARLLGVGPVSAAYEATRGAHDGAARGVLRLMIGSIGNNERARSHFLRASYAANRFQHPRVLSLSADGTDDAGVPFVVRPWADAEPLADVIAKNGPMTEPQVLRFAEQVLDAMEIAHAHGVVHGAISPSNVLITPRGSVRLCDFATPPGMGPRTEDDVLAARRVTPWTAPERCSSSPDAPTEATDVWALAACMYFASSKAIPRERAVTIPDLARTPAKKLRDVSPAVGETFAALIEHALEPDPSKRYESAYAMLGDVRRVMAGRKPKLGDAAKPNPSGSYSGPTPARSSRHVAVAARVDQSVMQTSPTSPRSDVARRPTKNEWSGNVALILAIAVLVGIATFVMVRERVEDERQRREHREPAAPGQAEARP